MFLDDLPEELKKRIAKCKLCNIDGGGLFYCHIHNKAVNALHHNDDDEEDDGGESKALAAMERGITISEYMNCGLTLDEAYDKIDEEYFRRSA